MSANRKHIFWDWNCTLLDDAEVILACVNTSLKMFAPAPLSMERFRQIPTTSLHDLYRMSGVPEEKIEDALIAERDIFHDNYERQADHVPLRKGAAGLLQKLKNNDVANIIVSNHITDQIIRLLKLRDIHHYFDEVLAFVDRAKQFRDITKSQRLRDYAEDNGVALSTAFIVGDTIEEIEIGHELGLCSVAITGGLTSEERLKAAKPDHLVHSLEELDGLFKERSFIV
jgi:phosphoglycolate phosphatase